MGVLGMTKRGRKMDGDGDVVSDLLTSFLNIGEIMNQAVRSFQSVRGEGGKVPVSSNSVWRVSNKLAGRGKYSESRVVKVMIDPIEARGGDSSISVVMIVSMEGLVDFLEVMMVKEVIEGMSHGLGTRVGTGRRVIGAVLRVGSEIKITTNHGALGQVVTGEGMNFPCPTFLVRAM